MRIRLTLKLAGCLDGIDVTNQRVGDIMELPDKAAAMLIAEGWAEAETLPSPASNASPIKLLSATH